MRNMKKEMSRIVAHVSGVFEPGAILEDSWGWEQTNIDFYVIASMNNSSGYAVIFPMKQIRSNEDGYMSRKNTPGEIDWNAKPIMKKIIRSKQTGEFIGFSLRNYSGGGWCSLWDGKESVSTHYA
jgi:hypothetical protein